MSGEHGKFCERCRNSRQTSKVSGFPVLQDFETKPPSYLHRNFETNPPAHIFIGMIPCLRETCLGQSWFVPTQNLGLNLCVSSFQDISRKRSKDIPLHCCTSSQFMCIFFCSNGRKNKQKTVASKVLERMASGRLG